MSGAEQEPNPGPGVARSTAASTGGLPRWSLTLVAGMHGLVFAWAGTKLPWSDWSAFAVVCWLLAAGHLATAIAAGAGLRWLPAIWRGASLASLLVLAWISWELIRSAAYLAGLYGDLGEGLGAAMLAVIGLFALLTLPLAAWGLAATWRRGYTRGAVAAAGIVVVAGSVGACREASAAAAAPLAIARVDADAQDPRARFGEALEQARADVLPSWTKLPAIPRKHAGKPVREPSLLTLEPVACVPDPDAEEAIAVVTFLVPEPDRAPDRTAPVLRERGTTRYAPVQPVSRCVRASPERLPAAILEAIASEAQRGPVKIDVIAAATPLRSRNPVLDMLAIRPGLDGVCDEQHCLMPWQLVAGDSFIANEPLAWVPDLRFGVSPVQLRVALGFEVPDEVVRWDREQRNAARLARLIEAGKAEPAPADPTELEPWLRLDGLTRIETYSYVFEPGGRLIPLIRGRERELDLTRARLDQALTLAETHIARASQGDGRFRYLLDPYTGEQQSTSWNLPRQAGTTLVVCELGRDDERTREVAARSLGFMAKHGRPVGDLLALTRSRRYTEADLGSTALPAIAFFRCRERVGSAHDETLAGITRFLLALQREDGSFYPKLDLVGGQPIDGPEPMYAGGQAIFALVLAEQLALDQPELAAAIGLPEVTRLSDAVERAMNFYAGPYWDNFARDFFWLEENWHCLAARAALAHHRNPAYEQFCVDYMSYKSRVVLDQDSEVAREFWGGYSMGNILVPVNTPAAGFAEGLAAAMAIKQARGDDLSEDRARMRRVLEFLVRQQWSEDVCFACAPNRTVVGGFSESMGAAEIRIDYTQHAWAGLGHGGAWIVDELADGSAGAEG